MLFQSPKNRATTTELLKHKFLLKRTSDALQRDLLDHIDAVGTHLTQDGETEEVYDAIEGLQGTVASIYDVTYKTLHSNTCIFHFQGVMRKL